MTVERFGLGPHCRRSKFGRLNTRPDLAKDPNLVIVALDHIRQVADQVVLLLDPNKR